MTGVLRFLRSNAIGLLALFVALGGTGYAALKVNGKNIKNGTITAKKLKPHTLTAKQINVSKLGTVPTASTANNASALGGSPASSYLRSGCGAGRIEGYATIHPTGLTSTYTSSAANLPVTYNCSGQQVQVRRIGTGDYAIKFPGNPGTIGFGNVHWCLPTALCVAQPQPTITVTFIPTGPDAGGFVVDAETSGTNTRQDNTVDVLIP